MAAVAYDLGGRVAVVTGAAGGIGRAILRRLGRAGASLVLWDRAKLDDASREHPDALAQCVDITDPAGVGAAAEAAAARFGRIDILVNNAGVLGPTVTTVEHDVAAFRSVVDINLTGAFICMRAVVPVMRRRPLAPDRGRIVNIASIQAKEGTQLSAAYVASKGGLVALTKTIGKELAAEGILVNAVTPSAVEGTRMLGDADAGRRADLLARIPMRRFVEPDEVAAQVIWLCSPDCAFATGAVFDISGGRATY